MCKVWPPIVIHITRVTRIDHCPDFIFAIKGFLTLTTDDIFEMTCAV